MATSKVILDTLFANAFPNSKLFIIHNIMSRTVENIDADIAQVKLNFPDWASDREILNIIKAFAEEKKFIPTTGKLLLLYHC